MARKRDDGRLIAATAEELRKDVVAKRRARDAAAAALQVADVELELAKARKTAGGCLASDAAAASVQASLRGIEVQLEKARRVLAELSEVSA
jgi:hypothetical protein